MLSLRKYAFSWMVAALIFYLCVRSSLPALFEVVRNNEVCVESESFELHYVQLRDILGHVFAFALLAFTLAWETFRTGCAFRTLRMIGISIVLSSLYGGALELIQQYFFPPRSAEWMDWICDALGAVMGWSFASLSVPMFDRLIKTK